jgi:cytochrome c553
LLFFSPDFFVMPSKLRLWAHLVGGALTGALAVAAGCTYSHGPEPAPCNGTAATYAAVVSPIFDAKCRTCHAQNVAATLGGSTSLNGWAEVSSYPEAALVGVIEHQPGYPAMPKNQAKLSDCEISLIKAWIAAGRPNN